MPLILFGQYPRSEPLVKATRDFDRGRVSKIALQRAYLKDFQELKDLQKGFPLISSGLLHWDDLMRPFAALIDGCWPGPLMRFFETNTFWRLLKAKKGARFQQENIQEWINKFFFPIDYTMGSSFVFTLPFLFLFRAFSQGLHLQEIAYLLERVVIEIAKLHSGLIIFFEPFVGWKKLGKDEKIAARHFLEQIKKKSQIPLALMTCFSSVEEETEFIYSLPLSAIGMDFYCNSVNKVLKNFPEDRSLIAGVISTESTLLEREEQILDFAWRVKKFLPVKNLLFTTSGLAELLPRKVMDQKLHHWQGVVSCL